MEKKHKRQTLGGKRKKSEYLHKNNKHRIKAKIKEKKEKCEENFTTCNTVNSVQGFRNATYRCISLCLGVCHRISNNT